MKFFELDAQKLSTLAVLDERVNIPVWDTRMLDLNEGEERQLEHILSHLVKSPLNLVNEATLWSRAIYPVLMLAEYDEIQAWSGVSLKASLVCGELEGIVDGILGKVGASSLRSPYIVVVEAKRGLEAKLPHYQLYGEMLAAAWLNQQQNNKDEQVIYGCYTIADDWTFVKGFVKELELDKPSIQVELSKEYSVRYEAKAILKILKFMVKDDSVLGIVVSRQ